MLIIYGALSLGGIETFIVRLAKQRFMEGKKTKICLILPLKLDRNNFDLLETVKQFAEIYYFDDLFEKKFIHWRLFLLHKLNKIKISQILEDCDLIHVADGQSALIAQEFIKVSQKKIPITVGVYHALEFSWTSKIQPYFEKINRKFIYEEMDSTNLLCFSQSTKDYLKESTGFNINNAQTFRLGVVNNIRSTTNLSNKIDDVYRLCTVGRLVDFKAYNIWLPEVIFNLNAKGYHVSLDIYGEGDMEEDIKKMIEKYPDYTKLLPSFDYSMFNNVVKKYDLFLGSGTAIVQASALKIPSIIGIESIKEPLTYGFFSDFYKYEYHRDGQSFKKILVSDLIQEYIVSSSAEKADLKIKHQLAANEFSIEECSANMDDSRYQINTYYKYNKYLYHFTKILFQIKLKIMRKTIYHKG